MELLNKLIDNSEDLVLYGKNNLPKITSILGIILTVGSCAGTGIATWKAKDKLEEHNDTIHFLHEDLHSSNSEGEKEKIKKEIMQEYAKTCITILGYYLPPALLLAGSIVCDISTCKQYEHKLAIASTSLILLKSAWDKSIQRAKEKYGEEAVADIFYGREEIKLETVDERGKKKTEKITTYDNYDIISANPCAILLGDGIESNLTGDYWYDISFLKSLETKWTYKLNSDGYVLVQDIYSELGVKPASKYQHDIWAQYGWIKDQTKIDNYISKCSKEGIAPNDEGIIKANRITLGLEDYINQRYISKDEPMVWILPNCMGDIMPFIFPESQLNNLKELTAK